MGERRKCPIPVAQFQTSLALGPPEAKKRSGDSDDVMSFSRALTVSPNGRPPWALPLFLPLCYALSRSFRQFGKGDCGLPLAETDGSLPARKWWVIVS